MKYKKSTLIILSLVFICMLMLTACNGRSDTHTDLNEPAADVSTAPTTAAIASGNTKPSTESASENETYPDAAFEKPENNHYTGNTSNNTSSNGQGVINTPKRCTVTVGTKGYVADVGDVITYTCYLKTPAAIEDVQASAYYDSSMLKLKSSDASDIFPVLGGSTVFNAEEKGTVRFNACNLRGFDFTAKGKLIELKFEVIGNGGTSITTSIEFMDEKGGVAYVDNYAIIGNITLEELLTQ